MLEISYWNCEGLLDCDRFFDGNIGPEIVTGFSLSQSFAGSTLTGFSLMCFSMFDFDGVFPDSDSDKPNQTFGRNP